MSNIEKIKKMIKGVYNQKVQVGYTPKSIHERTEGEIWEEPTGRKFVIEDGKQKQITKVPARGFDKCDDCEKLILKTIDQQTYNRMKRCKYCQIDFEVKLNRDGKWQEWVTDMEKQRWKSILSEYEQEIEELKENKSLSFDKTVTHALSDENIKSAMK